MRSDRPVLLFIAATLVVAIVCPGLASSASARQETGTPDQVVGKFYGWYTSHLPPEGAPLEQGWYKTSPYFTSGFAAKVESIYASFQGGAYDPFLCAQDVPDRGVYVGKPAITAQGKATVVVHLGFSGQAAPTSVTLQLEQLNDAWKIANIDCAGIDAGATTPGMPSTGSTGYAGQIAIDVAIAGMLLLAIGIISRRRGRM